jgi:hypothetical protein
MSVNTARPATNSAANPKLAATPVTPPCPHLQSKLAARVNAARAVV